MRLGCRPLVQIQVGPSHLIEFSEIKNCFLYFISIQVKKLKSPEMEKVKNCLYDCRENLCKSYYTQKPDIM